MEGAVLYDVKICFVFLAIFLDYKKTTSDFTLYEGRSQYTVFVFLRYRLAVRRILRHLFVSVVFKSFFFFLTDYRRVEIVSSSTKIRVRLGEGSQITTRVSNVYTIANPRETFAV